jgi:hypothetical protein
MKGMTEISAWTGNDCSDDGMWSWAEMEAGVLEEKNFKVCL